MLEGAIIGALVALIASFFLFLRARSAKGDKYLAAMPANAVRFDAPGPPADVIAALSNGVPAANVKLEGHDDAVGGLLLAQTPSMNNFGCFFPVRVSAGVNGGSQIDVGAAARATGNAKMLAKNLDKFLPELKKTLGVSDI